MAASQLKSPTSVRQAVELQRAEDSRRAALNLLEDAVLARQQVDRLNTELRESRQRLSSTIEQVKDYAIFSTDPQGLATTWNEGVQRILGFDEKDFIGQDIVASIFTPEDVANGVAQKELDTAAKEGTASNDRWMQRKSGERFYANGVTTGLRDDSGTLIGFTKVMRDTTGHKRFESLLFDLVERAPFGMYIVDSTFHITQMNAGSQAGAFRNVRPVVGRNFAEVVRILWPEPVAAQVIATFRHTLETGEPYYSNDFSNQRKDIETVESYEWVLHRMMLPDGDYGVVCYYYDSTGLRHAERTIIEQAEELAGQSRRKDEFLAMLAHELRNPLAPIANSIGILQRSGPAQPVSRPVTDMMQRQVQHMARLIDDLLDVSRVSQGKIEIRRTPVDIVSIVDQAVEAARPLLDSYGLTLTLALPSKAIHVSADPARMAQVISNLLNNAAKFTPRDGHVWVTVEREEGQAVIRVRDTGIGIGAGDLARVFDLFVQVDTALERVRGGLGVGLTLAKQLVELHDGTIEVQSGGRGQGAEFVVRLPVLMGAPAFSPRDHRQGDAAAATRRRVLVVDDNHDSAESLALLLELSGHDVRQAHDGVEAVEAATAFEPEVVVLDIGLPELNGYEAARQIRALPSGKRSLLIALTGWGQATDRQRSAESGFDVHLVKPVNPEALSRLIADLP